MKYVRELEGLRGLMAIWVVVGHWSTTISLPYHFLHTKLYNGYAVDVFVVLSRFAISALIDKRPEKYTLYLTRRFLRIFPVYLVFLAASIAIAPYTADIWADTIPSVMGDRRVEIANNSLTYFPWQLVAHVTALHGVIPPRILPDTDYAFLGQAWSISLEWQFYLVAPFLLAFIKTLATRSQARAPAVISALLFALVAAWSRSRMPDGFLPPRLYEFVIGIGSFYLLKSYHDENSLVRRVNIGAACLAGTVFCVFLKTPATIPFLIWIVVISAIIDKWNGQNKLAEWVCAVLLSRPAQWLGQMAYSIYLSHILVIMAGIILLHRMGITQPHVAAAILLGVTIPGTVLLSRLTYRAVEKPFHELGRSLGRKYSAVA